MGPEGWYNQHSLFPWDAAPVMTSDSMEGLKTASGTAKV